VINVIKQVEYLFVFIDCNFGVQQGIIRGMGKAHWATVGCFIGFYIIAIPLAVVLALKYNWALEGIISAMVLGEIFLVTFN
jgi:Na+-driven multidrug efflux pump